MAFWRRRCSAGSAELRFIERAVVVVKGWHTETFSPAVLARVRKVPGVVTATPLVQSWALARGPNGGAAASVVRGVSPTDLRRLNAAFFTMNGVISAVFLGFVLAEVL